MRTSIRYRYVWQSYWSFWLGCILAPVLLFGVWSVMQKYSEASQSFALMSEVNEIQWRFGRLRENIIDLKGQLRLAEQDRSQNYDALIRSSATWLTVNIDALLTQPFFIELVAAEDLKILQEASADTRMLFLAAGANIPIDYAAAMKLIDDQKATIWDMSVIVANANYVQSHAITLTQGTVLFNLWTAILIALTFTASWWLFFLYRSKSEYNHQVRQFALLFSHMTVTRVNALYLWMHDALSPDEFPDAQSLEKARKRIDSMRTLTQWLGRIAYPHFDEQATAMVPLKEIIEEAMLQTGTPKPRFRSDMVAAVTIVPQAYFHLILQELVSNAQDALEKTPNPRITVTASVSYRWLFGQRLTINVEDNGPGMNAVEIQQAITPFYSSKGEARGHSGLGLYGCIGMVRTMKGSFKITSQPDRGTTMQFTYPLSREARA